MFGLTTKFNKMQKNSNTNENPAIGNVLLADSATFKINTQKGIIEVNGKIIKSHDGDIYGIYKTKEVGNKGRVVWSLTCLHTGYGLIRFDSVTEALECRHLGFKKDVSEYLSVKKKMKPINDVRHYR